MASKIVDILENSQRCAPLASRAYVKVPVRRSKALLTNTSIIVLCFLIKFMRDRKDSRNLPFYISSEILKNRKEMLREMRKSVKLKESKKKQL